MIYLRPFVVIGMALLIVAGCEGSRRTVSGTVTFKGQALDQGRIEFFAKDGPPGPIGGAAIRNGKYMMAGDHGLDPGTYIVQISSSEPQKGVEVKMGEFPVTLERIPAEYNTKSTQSVIVGPRGSAQFDFNID